MSGQEVVRYGTAAVSVKNDAELNNLQQLGQILAKSGYFADARDMAQAAVKVMAGQELGIPPVAAMMGINIIKGKVALGANLIASRVRAHGYDYRHKQFDSNGCVLEFLSKAAMNGKRTVLGESSFTEEDAKAAGVVSDMYRKYPRNMYFSRAMSNGAKWYTPEVFSGMPIYTPEELGAEVDSEGEMLKADAGKIDTGGHPVGTEAAANAVADRKIKELSKPEPILVPTVEAPELAAIWASMKDFQSTVDAITRFKSDLDELAGSDVDYYTILSKHQMKHGNDIKGKTKAQCRAVVKELYELKQAVIKSLAPQPEYVADESDVPGVIGSQGKLMEEPEYEEYPG